MVSQDRDGAGRFRHSLVVALRFASAWGRHGQHGVGPAIPGQTRQPDRLPGRRRPGTHDDRHAASFRYGFAHRHEELGPLVEIERGCLTGGAGHHHRLHPQIHQLRGQVAGRRRVYLHVLAENSYQGYAHAREERFNTHDRHTIVVRQTRPRPMGSLDQG